MFFILLSEREVTISIYGNEGPVLVPDLDGGYGLPLSLTYYGKDVWQNGADHTTLRAGTLSSLRMLTAGERTLLFNDEKISTSTALTILFQRAKESVELFLGYPVHRVAIGAGCNATSFQKQYLLHAVEEAGLHLHSIFTQTEALAIGHEYTNGCIDVINTVALFVDEGRSEMGVFEIGDGVIESQFLYGIEHFSISHLVDDLINNCLNRCRFTGSHNNIDMARLRINCSQAIKKINLTGTYHIHVQDIWGNTILTVALTLNDMLNILDKPLQGLVNSIKEPSPYLYNPERALIVDCLPAFRNFIQYFLSKKFSGWRITMLPGGAVSGGARYTGVLGGKVRDPVLLAATSHAYGIITTNDHFCAIIAEKTTIPTYKEEKFLLDTSDAFVEVHILESRDCSGADCQLLGTVVLALPESHRNIRSEVSVRIDIANTFKIKCTAQLLNSASSPVHAELPARYELPAISSLATTLESQSVNEHDG